MNAADEYVECDECGLSFLPSELEDGLCEDCIFEDERLVGEQL